MRQAIRGADAVCHQAAKVGLGLEIGDITAYVTDNDLGTATLLRELARARFTGRLVLASSMVVYGEGDYECAEHGRSRRRPARAGILTQDGSSRPARRAAPPLTPHAVASRRRSIRATSTPRPSSIRSTCASRSHVRPGVPVTALRYHNVYGPRMPRDTPYAGVASIFASAIAAGRAPRVFEDGRQLRDFVHVRDVARANVLALTREQPVAGAFNVASGEPRTIGEMAQALCLAAGPAGPAPVLTGEYRLGRRAPRVRERAQRGRSSSGSSRARTSARHGRVRARAAAAGA